MWVFRRFSSVVIATIICMASGQAAEKIRYEEIPNRLAPFGTVLAYRGFTVITLDRKEHGGRRLRLESDHVRIFHLDNSYEDLPCEQISRIEISQGGRFFRHIVGSAEIPVLAAQLFCDLGESSHPSPACMVPVGAIFSPVWAYTAVTAPFYLAADGIAFLIPPKVYEIAH
jgi:hypothetical protein